LSAPWSPLHDLGGAESITKATAQESDFEATVYKRRARSGDVGVAFLPMRPEGGIARVHNLVRATQYGDMDSDTTEAAYNCRFPRNAWTTKTPKWF
jgi:hypothetical protein